MLADTAKLAIELNLTGNAAAGIRGIEQRLASLNRTTGQVGQGFRTIGSGVGVAARNIGLLAIPVLAGLSAGLIKSIREGQEAAKIQAIYANAVANSGKVSTQYVAILAKQRAELMNLAGIDDELIQTEQTRLIQMGLTGEQVAKLTPLILDMSKATGKDLLTSTIAVGKAVNGNTAGLQRFGIVIDNEKAKTDAYGATVDALNSKFAGTTEALSGSLDARLGAFRENLANIREEAGMKLLPALTRIVDVAGRQLVPAFGQFVDRVLPSIISGVEKFADALDNGGAERGIKAITDALGPMIDMLKLAAAPVKIIVDAFLKLPSQVQGVLIGGFAINKLSGGLIGQGIGQVAGGLLQRGGTPANPLFVADVTGGLGGRGGIPPIAGAGGSAAAAAGGFLAPGFATALAGVLTPILMFNVIPRLVSAPGGNELKPGQALGLTPTANQTMVSLGLGNLMAQTATRQGLLPRTQGAIGDFGAPHPGSMNAGSRTASPFDVSSFAKRRDFDSAAILERALLKGRKPVDPEAAVQATLSRNIAREQERTKAAVLEVRSEAARTTAAAQATAFAIRDKAFTVPPINVTTRSYVTSTDVQRATARRKRIAKPSGSRGALFEQYG